MHRFNRAGGAKRHVPALNAVLPGQRLQLLRRCHARAAEVFTVNGAARKVELGKADAAHPTALNQLRLKIFADYQLR